MQYNKRSQEALVALSTGKRVDLMKTWGASRKDSCDTKEMREELLGVLDVTIDMLCCKIGGAKTSELWNQTWPEALQRSLRFAFRYVALFVETQARFFFCRRGKCVC